MRSVTRRAFARCQRLMYVCRFERSLLFLVAGVAEARLGLLQDERADDAVALVTRLAAFRIGERSVHDFSRGLLQNRLVTFDAFRRYAFPPCSITTEQNQKPRRPQEHAKSKQTY